MNLLTHLLPTQLHPGFEIAPIPIERDSLFCSILSQLPRNKQRQTEPKASRYGLGGSGVSSCPQSEIDAMFFWMDFPSGSDKSSSQPWPNQSETQNTRRKWKDWLLLQSKIPLEKHLRSSDQLTERTHAQITMVLPDTSFNKPLEDMLTKTPE